ncbi:MAG: pyridoxamine 5'-phosphate oxidase [Gammaproteobacteria bacterium]
MDGTPLEKIAAWLNDAQTRSARRNPLAMALATCAEDGLPSVRMVLAKGFCGDTGHITFYTHFGSRKGNELTATPHAAAVMYWEEFDGRQLRVEGPVTRAPDDAADAYFATRPAASQLNAWVSEQSRPLPEPGTLEQRTAAKAAEFGLDLTALAGQGPAAIPRPPHWGGFRLWIEQVEFWTEGAGRFHERFVYRRSRAAVEQRRSGGEVWQRTQLQP